MVPLLKRYPLGALFGLVLTGLGTWVFDILPAQPWLEVPLTLVCVPGCMMIDRLIDWRFSGVVDARMRHQAAHEDAKKAFEKLEDYKARGIINKPDAHKIGAVIAKRDIAGGPRHRKSHPTSRKAGSPHPEPTGGESADKNDSDPNPPSVAA